MKRYEEEDPEFVQTFLRSVYVDDLNSGRDTDEEAYQLYVKSKLRLNEGVVSKETVVLRRWGSSIQKFGFINGVDNVNWPPYRDSKS